MPSDGLTRAKGSAAMNILLLIAYLALWLMVLFLGPLLLGALRAAALLGWRVAQLEATTPSRVGRSGLRPGKKAPEFTLPSIAGATEAGQVQLQDYAGRKLLLIFMQPRCGPCHGITPELNRLHDTGEIQVLVIHNADTEAVRGWVKESRPHLRVTVQEHFSVAKRYEVFATPFAFLIHERGVIAARGIVSTKQYLGFVLARAGHDHSEGEGDVEASRTSRYSSVDDVELSLASPMEAEHV
jgi:methylamine dehydrogenase accessory protein MauD